MLMGRHVHLSVNCETWRSLLSIVRNQQVTAIKYGVNNFVVYKFDGFVPNETFVKDIVLFLLWRFYNLSYLTNLGFQNIKLV